MRPAERSLGSGSRSPPTTSNGKSGIGERVFHPHRAQPGPRPPRPRRTEQKRPAAVPSGLPSRLLDRRPDVRVAASNLAAATANSGQARPCSSPAIASHLSFGFTSTEFRHVVSTGRARPGTSSDLLHPFFTAGKNAAVASACTESAAAPDPLRNTSFTIPPMPFADTVGLSRAYRMTGEHLQPANRVSRRVRKVRELAELLYRVGPFARLPSRCSTAAALAVRSRDRRDADDHGQPRSLRPALQGSWAGAGRRRPDRPRRGPSARSLKAASPRPSAPGPASAAGPAPGGHIARIVFAVPVIAASSRFPPLGS